MPEEQTLVAAQPPVVEAKPSTAPPSAAPAQPAAVDSALTGAEKMAADLLKAQENVRTIQSESGKKISKLEKDLQAVIKASRLQPESVERLTQAFDAVQDHAETLGERYNLAQDDVARLAREPDREERKSLALRLANGSPAASGALPAPNSVEATVAKMLEQYGLKPASAAPKGNGLDSEPFAPAGGMGAPAPKTIKDLADGDWDPKAAAQVVKQLGVRHT